MCVRIHKDLINADNYTVLGKNGSEKNYNNLPF